MSLPKNIKEWYQQFLQLAEAEGVDVNSPASGSMFRSIDVSVHTRVNQGEQETEYRDDGVPLSAPSDEAKAHIDDPMWLFNNTQPISRMTEDQIRNLYELAKDGKVAFNTVTEVNGEPKKERKLVYTGTDTLPHFSGPLSQGPLVENRNVPIPAAEQARMEPTFPNAPDPLALAELSTRHIMAANVTGLSFAMAGEEKDRRIASSVIFGELVADRASHPDYYATPENAEIRSKIVASGTYESISAPNAPIPREFRTEKDYHYQVSKGVESNILSISTAGMSLDDMITAGLIRREDGTAYTHGDRPWSARTELAGEVGKTICIYRPGVNGGEPQLDGTVTMRMKAGLVDFEKTRTEESNRKKENETAFKGVQAHKTVYGGIRVASSQKNQLERQPAGEFLAFEPNSDGSFNMRYKLPENGRFENREFKIRENINYFIRGISRMCFDDKGNIDFTEFDRFSNEFATMSGRRKLSPEFADSLGVPEEKRADFFNFVRSCEDFEVLRNEILGFEDMSISLRQFQYSMSALYQPNQPVDEEKEKLLTESYGDFQKKLENLRKLTDINPETETGIFNYLDCGFSSTINMSLLPMVNQYRANHNQPEISVPERALDSRNGRLVIEIDREGHRDDPANGNYNMFGTHACFAVNAKLNGRDVLLSMETTAPPTGKMLFSDARGETGMGIYKDKDELFAYHRKDSYRHVKDIEKFQQLKGVPNAVAKTVKAVRGSHIIETKLRTGVKTSSHTMEELSKRLSSWKIDNPMVPSSPQFAAMKDYFKACAEAKTPMENLKATKKLNIAAQYYLDYKEPKGDAVKSAKLSDYAKRRLDFVRDVLDYTSAKLNQVGAAIPNVSEIKRRRLMENDAPGKNGPEAPAESRTQTQTQSKKEETVSLGGR